MCDEVHGLWEADDPIAERERWHSDTALYFECPDVDSAYRHFRDHGFELDPPQITHYGMRQLSLTDPDGYGLCFQWPAEKET